MTAGGAVTLCEAAVVDGVVCVKGTLASPERLTRGTGRGCAA
jgi:hypothetical protein